jgi:hypothetical protein
VPWSRDAGGLATAFAPSGSWKALAFLALWAAVASAQVSDIKPDEEVVLFPAIGSRANDGSWSADIEGCVYEPEQRRLTLALLREALELKDIRLTAQEDELFKARARLFMVDHERGNRIVVRINGQDYDLGKSGPDGRFGKVVRFASFSATHKGGGSVEMRVVLPATDQRVFKGRLALWERTGITVISDIDDTIKKTNVRDRKAMLRNTFLQAYEPVPGMAELYRRWADERGAQFCYVSASPWQLFEPLSQFIQTNGFPEGAFFMKRVRWKDQTLLNLFQDPESYKQPVIRALLRKFPRREFVLVGDSGERDPEAYGQLARKYPNQITQVLIRNVTDESPGNARFYRLFHGLAPKSWKLFSRAEELATDGGP